MLRRSCGGLALREVSSATSIRRIRVVAKIDLGLRKIAVALNDQRSKRAIAYELGGLEHSFCVLLFKVDAQKQVQFVWGGKGFQSAKSLDQLRKLVAG